MSKLTYLTVIIASEEFPGLVYVGFDESVGLFVGFGGELVNYVHGSATVERRKLPAGKINIEQVRSGRLEAVALFSERGVAPTPTTAREV